MFTAEKIKKTYHVGNQKALSSFGWMLANVSDVDSTWSQQQQIQIIWKCCLTEQLMQLDHVNACDPVFNMWCNDNQNVMFLEIHCVFGSSQHNHSHVSIDCVKLIRRGWSCLCAHLCAKTNDLGLLLPRNFNQNSKGSFWHVESRHYTALVTGCYHDFLLVDQMNEWINKLIKINN